MRYVQWVLVDGPHVGEIYDAPYSTLALTVREKHPTSLSQLIGPHKLSEFRLSTSVYHRHEFYSPVKKGFYYAGSLSNIFTSEENANALEMIGQANLQIDPDYGD